MPWVCETCAQDSGHNATAALDPERMMTKTVLRISQFALSA